MEKDSKRREVLKMARRMRDREFVAVTLGEVDFLEHSRKVWHIACHEAGSGECHCYCEPPLGCGEDCPAYNETEAKKLLDLLDKLGIEFSYEDGISIPHDGILVYPLEYERELEVLAEHFNIRIFRVRFCEKCEHFYRADGEEHCCEDGWLKDWSAIVMFDEDAE